ncbi:ParB N-terminal domain-containing protein [Streptomyces sp. NPDC094049]|uniref:ParB/RepB/Spo0J family partition protein n=1 Tax=Streptomyces sp. NPDC094049 TaxID=3154987 RepID=UPI00332F8A07
MSSTPGLGDLSLAEARAAARAARGAQGQTLLPAAEQATSQTEPRLTAKLAELMPSPENMRAQFYKIDELAESLRVDGVHQAITVIPPKIFIDRYPQHAELVNAAVARGACYVVHHGHRRLVAAAQAGLEEVPIVVRRVVTSIRIASIQENQQRMGLNPVEEGREFQDALLNDHDENGKAFTQRSLAARTGASQTYISHRVALLRLIPSLQEAVINHWLRKHDIELDEGAPVLQIRQAATIYAPLRDDLQQAFVDGKLSDSEVAVVCKLREDLQFAFLNGELTAEEAAVIGKLPPKDQALPERTVVQTTALPANVPPAGAPADGAGEATEKPDVPHQRDEQPATGDGVLQDEAALAKETDSSSNNEQQESASNFGPEVSAGGEQQLAVSQEPGGTATGTLVTTRVIEIRDTNDLDQLAETLTELLTDEERAYLLEKLF